MQRPTAAQFSYGSVTVVFSTLAMLLLSRTSSDLGIAVVAAAGLALGLLVAVAVPAPTRRRTSPTGAAPSAHQDTRPAHETGDHAVGQVQRTIPAARTSASARVGEHSLRH
uniref:Secreted protein n=1 Tax=Streptomyces sp. NBC_00008 TaxID=2903610 RepID=A0AAU2VW82_9ACTN